MLALASTSCGHVDSLACRGISEATLEGRLVLGPAPRTMIALVLKSAEFTEAPLTSVTTRTSRVRFLPPPLESSAFISPISPVAILCTL